MSKRIKQFSQEQIELLLQNPNIEDVTANTIKFTAEFKEKALELSSQGMQPLQIFKNAGIDLKIIGKSMPANCITTWRYREKHYGKSNNKYLAKETKKNKILKEILEENKYLRAENEFLKKLQALQEIAEQD